MPPLDSHTDGVTSRSHFCSHQTDAFRRGGALPGGAMQRVTRSQGAGSVAGCWSGNQKDAVSLISDVRERFAHARDIYEDIIAALQEFKSGSLPVGDFADVIEEKLDGHADLKRRFNTYLPDEYKMVIQDRKPRSTAIKRGGKSNIQVEPKIRKSVATSRRRQDGRARSLPGEDASRPRPVHRKETRGRGRSDRRGESSTSRSRRSQPSELSPEVVERLNRMKRAVGEKSTEKLLDEGVKFVKSVKACFQESPEIARSFLECMQKYSEKKISLPALLEGIALLFQSQPKLLKDFQFFLEDQPEGKDLLSRCVQRTRDFGVEPKPLEEEEAEKANNTAMVEPDALFDTAEHFVLREMGFLRRIKGRLRSAKTYGSFMKLLSLFTMQVINRDQLETMVETLVMQEDGAMDSFKQFLAHCDSIGNLGELSDNRHPLMKIKQAMTKKKDYDKKPVQQLDTSDMERCTPSYLMLPKDYPKLHCSGRNCAGLNVLNDIMVSIPTGSEDNGKQLQKNVFEEQLFRFEDNLYEIDVSMSRCQSTLTAVENLHDKLVRKSPEELSGFVLPNDIFSPLHVKMIRALYGKSSDKVFKGLQEKPLSVVKIIIVRLKQKLGDWQKSREEVLNGWQKVFDENYLKSLDHQSQTFKQTEKKELSLKTLVSEIEAEMDRKMDTELKVRQAFGQVTWEDVQKMEHLTFKMDSQAASEDLVEMVNMGLDLYLNRSEREKVRNFFNEFLVPFFDLPASNTAAQSDSPPISKNTGAEPQGGAMEDVEIEEAQNSGQGARCQGCAPLCIQNEDGQEDSLPNGHNVLFCTDQFYWLLRLIQVLYNRLKTVRDLSRKASQHQAPAQPSTSGRSIPNPHSQFLDLLDDFLRGKVGGEDYEDQCRRLLGVHSYVVFTLDRFLDRLAKLMKSLYQSNVVDLYGYQQRCRDSTERQYFSNARTTLSGDHHFRVAFDVSERRLSMQLLDWVKDLGVDLETDSLQERGVKSFIEKEAEEKVNRIGKQPLFLERHVEVGKERREGNGHLVHFTNGLEFGLKSETCKVGFHSGTEDFLVYLGKKKDAKEQEILRWRRKSRFLQWVDIKSSQHANFLY